MLAHRPTLRSCLVVLPTGTGKTVFFGALARKMNERTLVLVHREELVQQTLDKFKMVWPEASAGVVKGRTNDLSGQVVVGSIQTLERPNRREQLPRFGLIIVDEAHHYVATSYRRVLGELGCGAPDGPFLVGVTATPQRTDNIGLSVMFEKVVYFKTMIEMIRKGYLCDLVGKTIRTNLDLGNVKITAGDYDELQLSRVVNTPAFNKLVVTAYQREALGRQAIAFTCSVQHAQDLAKAFCSAGVPAGFVDGSMKPGERSAAIEDFRRRRTRVLCNCQILTEGFDEPSVAAVVMARPTQSQGLYVQCVGRGARLYPGKDHCIVLDFVGASGHGLQTLPVLFGLPAPDLARHGGSVAKATALGLPKRRDDRRREAVDLPDFSTWRAEAVDLFTRTAMRWMPVDEGAMCLMGGDSGNVFLVASEDGWRAFIVKREEVKPLADRPLEIGYAQGVAEDWVRTNGAEILANRTASWRSKPAKPRQIETLKKFGVNLTSDLTAGEASDMITLHLSKLDLTRLRKFA